MYSVRRQHITQAGTGLDTVGDLSPPGPPWKGGVSSTAGSNILLPHGKIGSGQQRSTDDLRIRRPHSPNHGLPSTCDQELGSPIETAYRVQLPLVFGKKKKKKTHAQACTHMHPISLGLTLAASLCLSLRFQHHHPGNYPGTTRLYPVPRQSEWLEIFLATRAGFERQRGRERPRGGQNSREPK
jgi:hypothetical protein